MTGRRAVAIATITAVLASAGTATAAKLITSRDIKDGTIATRDVKKNSVTLNRLSPGVRKQLAKAPVAGVSGTPTPVPGQPGAPGAAGGAGGSGANGAQGEAGAKGDTGAQGQPGQAIVANVTTAQNPGLNNLRVVQVERTKDGDASPGPENTDPGTTLVQTALPAGRYILAGTAQFATLGGTANAFGLARVFVGNTSQGSLIFTAEIPAQPLLGQTGASTEITVPAGGATVSLRAQAQSATGDQVLGGANLLITQVTP